MMQFVSQIMQKGMKSGYELGKGGYEVRKILEGSVCGPHQRPRGVIWC